MCVCLNVRVRVSAFVRCLYLADIVDHVIQHRVEECVSVFVCFDVCVCFNVRVSVCLYLADVVDHVVQHRLQEGHSLRGARAGAGDADGQAGAVADVGVEGLGQEGHEAGHLCACVWDTHTYTRGERERERVGVFVCVWVGLCVCVWVGLCVCGCG